MPTAGIAPLVAHLVRPIGVMDHHGFAAQQTRHLAPRGRGEPASAPPQAVTPLGPESWRLNPPFQPDGACGWVVPPGDAPVLAEWDRLADDVEHPERSPLLILS